MPVRWKKLSDFDYYISNTGLVKRVYKNGKEKILKQHKTGLNKQYLFVCLSNKQKKCNKLVHRLVMEAFCGKSHKDVNHIDFNTTNNNNLNNLEYVTRSENLKHSASHNRLQVQDISHNCNRKLNVYSVLTILTMGKKYKKILAKHNKTSLSNINHILRRSTWSDNYIYGFVTQEILKGGSDE